MHDIIQITTTTDSEDKAKNLAHALVECNLAACVQIAGPITSVYRWDGKIETATEWTCSIKTPRGMFNEVEKEILSRHDYELPEIVATPIIVGSVEYLEWIREETEGFHNLHPIAAASPSIGVHFIVHGRPDNCPESSPYEINGVTVPTLEVTKPEPLSVNFDDVCDVLAKHERMFLEPDGSLVWSGDDWRLNGQINDAGPQIDHVELNGNCTEAAWKIATDAFGGMDKLVIQCVRQGVYISADRFVDFCKQPKPTL